MNPSNQPISLRRCACIGGGVIGAGWACRMLLNGMDVAVFDPDPATRERTKTILANAERAWQRLYEAPLPPQGALKFTKTLAEAVEGVQLIQESLPEKLELKRSAYRELEAVAASDALIASSTSGLTPTDLQEGMQHPQRLLVGHPFQPVYLMPLVEIVGGRRTDPASIERAKAFYGEIGMTPVVIGKEIEAFVADRLMEALWREALWLIKDGVATAGEIDDIMRLSFGLRWASMGLFQTYHLAGGEAGMRHFLRQFAPCLALPWTKLTEVPEMDEAFVDQIVEQTEASIGGRTLAKIERLRDDNLVATLQALQQQDEGRGWGAGAAVNRHRRLLTGRAETSGRTHEYRTALSPDWLDHGGRLSDAGCRDIATLAARAFVSSALHPSSGSGSELSYFSSRATISNRDEGVLQPGNPVHVETRVLSADGHSLQLAQKINSASSELASIKHVLQPVDPRRQLICEAPAALIKRLQAMAAAAPPLKSPTGAPA